MPRAASAPHVQAIKLRIDDPSSEAIAQARLAATPNFRELRMQSVPWPP